MNRLKFGTSALILGNMISHPGNSNWLEIDRGALAHNLQRFKELTSVRVMAVVKANGYGHGITEVAKVAARSGAAYCGVARVDEALELRRAGVDIPVKVHITVDTGMSRLGAKPEEAYELVQRLSKEKDIDLEGIFTHYACADEPDNPLTAQQESLFLDLLSEIQSLGLRPKIAHASNSAAALTRPSSHLDMVRIGIALYGMPPSPEVQLPEDFRPSLTWKAQLTSVFTLPPGSGISYGHRYRTTGYERIGVVPVGYGDGYRRVSGNQVLIGGKRIPVVGRVCMDQIMVQLDELPTAQVGDEVVLLGSQGDETISASELAQKWGTINYEATCDLSARVPRFYYD
jgi:alanine racemase